MDDDKKDVVTKEWCSQVTESCSVRMRERYESMKELFQSKLKGIAEQLEITITDIQKSLSVGVVRMQANEKAINALDVKLQDELKSAQTKVEEQCVVMGKRVDVVSKALETHQKPNWTMWSIVAVILIAITGEMLTSWRNAGIMEERLANLQIEMKEHKDIQQADLVRLKDRIDKLTHKHATTGEVIDGI